MKYLSDTQFVADLYQRYAGDLYAACHKSIGVGSEFKEIIDDCVEDTFVECLRCCGDVRQLPDPGGWLHRTCKNKLWDNMDRYVARCLKTILPGDRVLDRIATDDPADVVALAETLGEIRQQLSNDAWVVFVDVLLNKAPVEKIAMRLNVSIGEIEALLRRVSIKLTRYFKSKELL